MEEAAGTVSADGGCRGAAEGSLRLVGRQSDFLPVTIKASAARSDAAGAAGTEQSASVVLRSFTGGVRVEIPNGVVIHVSAEIDRQTPAEQKPGEVRRKKRVERKLCLDAPPQVHHETDVDGVEKSCSHCSCDKVCIGDDFARVLELIPAKLEVHHDHHRKFAFTCEKSGVTTPPPPAVPIPKSIAGASLVASLTVTKTGDHFPTFRSEDISHSQAIWIRYHGQRKTTSYRTVCLRTRPADADDLAAGTPRC